MRTDLEHFEPVFEEDERFQTRKLVPMALITLLGLAVIFAFAGGSESVPVAFESQDAHTQGRMGRLRDEHGCLLGGGYTWCESKGKCLRTWEEPCPPTQPVQSTQPTQPVVAAEDTENLNAGKGTQVVVKVSEFGPYPGTDFTVSGKVIMRFSDTTVSMDYHLKHVDPKCTQPANVPNSCGIHIHVGHTCKNGTLVGGHYFDASTHPADPWLPDHYIANDKGETKGTISVEYGFGYETSAERALVVHDITGARMSCAIIP